MVERHRADAGATCGSQAGRLVDQHGRGLPPRLNERAVFLLPRQGGTPWKPAVSPDEKLGGPRYTPTRMSRPRGDIPLPPTSPVVVGAAKSARIGPCGGQNGKIG